LADGKAQMGSQKILASERVYEACPYNKVPPTSHFGDIYIRFLKTMITTPILKNANIINNALGLVPILLKV